MSAFVLAHLSDPHLSIGQKPMMRDLLGKRALGYLNWSRNRRKAQHGIVLDLLVEDMQQQNPHHIAVTGDLINLSLVEEFAPARAWLESVGEAQRVSLVPGNHDAYIRATRHHFQREWADYMRGDDDPDIGVASFPYLRRRGLLALIGVSTAVPTPPLMATGHLGPRQLEALDRLLPELGKDGLCRVLLIHHPLRSFADRWQKRLTDAPALLDILHRHGVELVLHGHDHRHSVMWFDGPTRPFPAVGVPSASAGVNSHRDPAAYNLFSITYDAGWRIEMATRGLKRGLQRGESTTEGADPAIRQLRAKTLLQPD